MKSSPLLPLWRQHYIIIAQYPGVSLTCHLGILLMIGHESTSLVYNQEIFIRADFTFNFVTLFQLTRCGYIKFGIRR